MLSSPEAAPSNRLGRQEKKGGSCLLTLTAIHYVLAGDTTGGSCVLHGNVIFSDSNGVCTVKVTKAAQGIYPAASLVIPVTFYDN